MAFNAADPGIVGDSYPAALILQDTQRTLNFYPEKSPEPRSKEPVALLGCPGVLTLIGTQTAAVRGAWVLPGGTQALVVTGNTLYLINNTVPAINGAPPVFTATSVGTLLTSVGPVIMRDNGVLQNGLGGYCLIVDGSYGYYYLLSGATYTNQFTGTLTAGSATLTFPGELPNGLIVASTPTLAASSGAIPGGTTVIYIDTIALTLTMSASATASTTGVALTFTHALALGATAGTLTPVWGGLTGSDTIQFSDGETRLVTLTHGSGAVSWTPGLTNAVLATASTVSGNDSETITLTIPVFGQITDQGFLGADHIAFIEGFLVCNQPNSRTFFCTGPTAYQMLFPGLFFALKDSSTDNLVTLYEENRELWLAGERTSEVWYNAGGSGSFPFQRIPGVGPQIGCSAKYSISRVGAQLVWLARNEQGENMVVCTNQYTWSRLSTHAVEHAISSYSTINDAIGYGYEEEGHVFYMLIFPTADSTWCFDFTDEFWHERASWDPHVGIYHRHRSNCFMNFANTRIVGDYQTGNLMQMSRAFYTDNGAPLRALRRSPHVWQKQTRERVFYSQLQIEFLPGVGIQGAVQLILTAGYGEYDDETGQGFVSSGVPNFDQAFGSLNLTPYLLAGFPIAAIVVIEAPCTGIADFVVVLEGNATGAAWSFTFTDSNAVTWVYSSTSMGTPTFTSGYTVYDQHYASGPHPLLISTHTYTIAVTVGADSALGLPPVGVIPQAMLRFSSDGGQTWSQERWASIGQAGQTKNRAMWRQLGQARDRVFEVVVSDAVRRDIIGATLFAEGSS